MVIAAAAKLAESWCCCKENVSRNGRSLVAVRGCVTCCFLMGRLEWPLHLVLTREAMQTYNRLFRLLASVKRASLELERVWPTLMQSRYR